MHPFSSELRSALARDGYALHWASASALSTSMLHIASGLGTPIPGRRGGPLIEPIIPLDRHAARARSLSRLHGLEQQPWHVDGAHRVVPPRFIVFGCAGVTGTGAPTTALVRFRDLPALKDPQLTRAPFAVQNGQASFYSTVASRDRTWIRYDPGCMTPRSDEARRLAGVLRLDEAIPAVDLVWSASAILVIDNWAVFHRRSFPTGDGHRQLLRISVMEK